MQKIQCSQNVDTYQKGKRYWIKNAITENLQRTPYLNIPKPTMLYLHTWEIYYKKAIISLHMKSFDHTKIS